MIKYYKSTKESSVRKLGDTFVSIYEDDLSIWFERDNPYNINKWKILDGCVFTTHLFPNIMFYIFAKETFKRVYPNMTLVDFQCKGGCA